MKKRSVAACLLPLAMATVHAAPQQTNTKDAWVADLGDGRYQNPVLHADYSDPDAIRVGDTYYMTSSSFNSAPGLPLLQSKDMVNWELVGHALPKLVPEDHFAVPRHGDGVWAPCLRYHDGKFWIFYPDPDFGIFVITAEKFTGPWTKPHLLLPGKGIIDPTPLWDDDGKAWLLHGWAKSRAGINNLLTLRSMAPDASGLLDTEGKTIIDGNKIAGYRTLEGPKFYKEKGWYYVFAPAGGVEDGWQAVFRSRSLEGPYEVRTVMDQGKTPINGPHQGAWVRAQDGSDWFLHFQDKGAYGRLLHLQPMRWVDGWPIIGEDGAKAGVGQPVLAYKKPVAGFPVKAPPTSDEFNGPTLGLQWQWNANSDPRWYSLTERPGYLRLHTQVVPEANGYVRATPALLAQKPPAPVFAVNTHVQLNDAAEGDRAGLIVNAMQYAWLGLRKTAGATQLVYTTCTPAKVRCTEKTTVVLPQAPNALYLRMNMAEGALASFSYSADNANFTSVGQPLAISKGRWVGAQIGVFTVGEQAGAKPSSLDVDYFRVTPQ
ncbi:glycoside hydrolase family 43 protein [Massilia terrae]|uniref:Glycoside hydrolase 43 family protein n=1 Tax=Massilia terrae TaxID=1811224 RepID=A0ABT2CZT5_9BURK|nr:glycoside hydrolase 43 family protein [Massilia terrae]MCS0659091.1 glycoside hydrolase 43 family protein [Massilia terrae]